MKFLARIIVVMVGWLVFSQAGAQEAAKTREEITVGVYINDIQQLDLRTHSYAMDFYVWLHWTNPELTPHASLEFMNPFQLWGMIATPLYEEPQDMPDGSKYMATRYQGQFNSKLPLEKYPFDSQSLVIEFEDSSAGASQQVFVPDTNPVTLNPEMTLPGYILGAATLTIDAKPYPTTFGDARLTEPDAYSRVTVAVQVHRPSVTYAIKVILPILLVVICAGFVFYIHPSFVEGRIGMGITALLTLVALQLTTNSELPEVDYLMMIDMLYLLAYLFVIASLGQVVRTSWTAQRGEDRRAIGQDRQALLYLGGAYAIGTVVIMLVTLGR